MIPYQLTFNCTTVGTGDTLVTGPQASQNEYSALSKLLRQKIGINQIQSLNVWSTNAKL